MPSWYCAPLLWHKQQENAATIHLEVLLTLLACKSCTELACLLTHSSAPQPPTYYHPDPDCAALLATATGDIVVECENSVVTDKDITAHAELALVRKASKALAPAFLQTLTLYTSTEPCAMCAGAIFWSGIPRVVYGCSETSLYALTGNPVAKKLIAAADTAAAAATAHSKDSADELIAAGGAHTLFLPCRDVFAHGGRKISVTGPVEEEAARKPHEGFWV